jgi:hypothetical protein
VLLRKGRLPTGWTDVSRFVATHTSDPTSFEVDGTGFYAAACNCGWRSGYLPDLETVCDALMEHAASAGAGDLQSLEVKAPADLIQNLRLLTSFLRDQCRGEACDRDNCGFHIGAKTADGAADWIEQLEGALYQHGHVVDVEETRFGLEHPVSCRAAGLLNCPIDGALRALDGPPALPGRYPIELRDDGILVVGDRL